MSTTHSTHDATDHVDARFIGTGNNSNATLHYDYYNVDHYFTYLDYPIYYYSHYFHIYEFEAPIYGYLWPALVFMVSGSNVLVVLGFLRKKMQNPTYLLLISVAISDSLAGLVTLPGMFHVYLHSNMLLTKEWCIGLMVSRHYISRAFHTVSIWQSLLLVIYRYLFLCRPLVSRRWCNMRNTFVSIIVIYVLGFIFHMYHAFNIKATDDGFCQWAIEEPCVQTCVYIWFSLLFVHLLPSFLGLFITMPIIIGINKAYHNFTSTNSISSSAEEQKHKILTKVVVIISIIWLIPEIPYGIYYLIVVGQIHNGQSIFPLEINRKIHLSYEVAVIISFHCNFWVYVLMIRRFRLALKRMFQFTTCRNAQLSESADTASSTNQGNGLDLPSVNNLERVNDPQRVKTNASDDISNTRF
ncbi:hypothetical protein CHS0354_041660 [Potamilus streckersoni]|uniref:G-protein coupled receptors family 1 profile domain-containing protein n=1 Tax=Potamilus streckersoni TaxID=2493646 RepID=A0AAE0SCJ0_9BIVA|nr:hypothetical protein CHS0354_041660 [Potamilus streckersoni]